jgi:putative ABC transport system substrate-binding protein
VKRRDFIALTGGAMAFWPLTVRAQHPANPVVGFLNPNRSDAYPDVIAAFRDGLRETGFVERENVTILYRWADGDPLRVPRLVNELVNVPVTVIAATGGGATAVAAKAATTAIPIVFNSAEDPVKAGLVLSLSHPGGNLTGVSRVSVELMPKRLELLHEAVPRATPVGYLVEANSAVAGDAVAQDAARTLGLELRITKVNTESNLEGSIAEVVRLGAKSLLIGSGSYFNARSKELGELCVRYALPAIYQTRAFVTAGGLMSYGPNLADAYRLVGIYTGRILKGEKPTDLPVQQQTKVNLTINAKTARTLGIIIPLPLLGRADEVVD